MKRMAAITQMGNAIREDRRIGLDAAFEAAMQFEDEADREMTWNALAVRSHNWGFTQHNFPFVAALTELTNG